MGAFASALSEHPITSQAIGEVVGQVLDQMEPEPDLALLFVTPGHAGALEDAARTVQALLRPRTLLGAAAESVVGTGREVEGGPAVSLWASRVGQARPLRLEAMGPEGPVLGWPEDAEGGPGMVVLVADPFSFPAEVFFSTLAEDHPGLEVVGGMASAAARPGGNRLVLDGEVVAGGAVGALLPGEVAVEAVVSQGCRPIGHPLVVTSAAGNILYELAGEPPLQRLATLAKSTLTEEEVDLINQGGLHLGRVVDEHRAGFGVGDFLVRNVLGADRTVGAIAVNDRVETGTTVQFHLRDAEAADQDLRRLLAGRQARSALLFTCNGRGTRLFGKPHHDAGVLSEVLGPVPVAGFFAAGEFGPVAGRNFVHGFTASMALFPSA
jgi:small ligand-binding sensory domain FIST